MPRNLFLIISPQCSYYNISNNIYQLIHSFRITLSSRLLQLKHELYILGLPFRIFYHKVKTNVCEIIHYNILNNNNTNGYLVTLSHLFFKYLKIARNDIFYLLYNLWSSLILDKNNMLIVYAIDIHTFNKQIHQIIIEQKYKTKIINHTRR